MRSGIAILVSALAMGRQVAAQHSDRATVNLVAWCVPSVVVTLVFIGMTAAIVYTVYRQKKYGAFCCLMPKMHYRVQVREESGDSACQDDYPPPPPAYNVSHQHGLAPPDYCDALQDVLLDSGERIDPTAHTNSRYTMWSSVLVSSAPPEYTAVAPDVQNTELETAGSSQDDLPDTASINSLSYTTISTPPLNLVSSDELITGAGETYTSQLPRMDTQATTVHEKRSRMDSTDCETAPLNPNLS